MTNYERIKNMSVEEMAVLLANAIGNDPCSYCLPSNDSCGDKWCADGLINWLNKEVKQNDKSKTNV